MNKKFLTPLLAAALLLSCIAPAAFAKTSELPTYEVRAGINDEAFPELDYAANKRAGMQPRAGADLPSSYDLTSYSWVSSVKNQGMSNLCWTFSAASVIESSILKNGGPEMDFSEQHIAYSLSRYTSEGENGNKEGLDRTPNGVGSARKVQAYLSRFSGPVLEKDDPFTFFNESGSGVTRPLEYTLQKPKAAYVGDCINIPNPTERTAEQIKLHRETVKRCLMEYGAIGMAFNTSANYTVTSASQTAQGAGTLGNCYYDGEGGKDTNHLVTIVGWDDNYPRENFRSDKRPSANGAFRVKNSRGENYNDQGGYFWLSYEDYYAGWYAWCVEKVTPADTYDSVYYHDPFGADYYITGSNKMYGANVFERRGGDAAQTVTAVGVSVLTPNVTVSVYVNNGKNQFAASTLTTRSFELPGYYTIPLDAPVNITQTEFTVGAIYSAPSGTKLGLPFEKATQASLSVCNAGESFYGTDGVSYTDASLKFGNLSIRALTSESRLELNSEKLDLTVGQAAVLKATTIPQADDNKIKWSSSNAAVVSVDGGVLTAKSAGTATITATAENGTSCTCLVTVRQPSELLLSASSAQVGEECELTCTLSGNTASKQIHFYIFREGKLLLSRVADSDGKTIYVPNKSGEYLAFAVCQTDDGETLTAKLRFTVK